jgi:hypothetical protein
LVAATLVYSSGTAVAQRFERPPGEPSDEAMEEGSRLYEEGRVAADAARWADAIAPLARAYRLTGRPVALYSLALAFRATGRFRDARDACTQLIEDHGGELDDELRASAEEMLAQATASVAVITLRTLDDPGGQRLRLDGREVDDDGSRPLPIETDPGRHALRVDRAGHLPFEWEGQLDEGQHLSLDVALEPEPSSVWESPWLWAGVGAGAAAIAIVIAVVAQSAAQLEPRSEHTISL